MIALAKATGFVEAPYHHIAWMVSVALGWNVAYEPALGIRSFADLPSQAYLDAVLLVIVGVVMLRGPTALSAGLQTAGAEALTATARPLAELAERMRAAVARFSVDGGRHRTA